MEIAALTEQIDAAVEAEEYDAAEALEEARVTKVSLYFIYLFIYLPGFHSFESTCSQFDSPSPTW